MYEEDEGVSPNLEAALNGQRSAAGQGKAAARWQPGIISSAL